MKIWPGDEGTCNRLYLYPIIELLGVWIRLELFSGDPENGHVSCDCPMAEWTRVVILRRPEIDHYKPIEYKLTA